LPLTFGGERKVSKLEDVLDSSKIAKTIEGTVRLPDGELVATSDGSEQN